MPVTVSDMHILVEELERRRLTQGVSKNQLARELGISRHTVARKLSGETELTVGEAYRMCQVLGTSLQDVLDLLEFSQHAEGA
jgi:transcriptional regulator with XRE-family HTH domain